MQPSLVGVDKYVTGISLKVSRAQLHREYVFS